MRHARRTIVAIALATTWTVTGCSDSGTASPPKPITPSATPLAGAEADSAITAQAKVRAAHGDSALLRYLVDNRQLWDREGAAKRDPSGATAATRMRQRLDEVGPLRSLTWNGSTYDWDGTVPEEDAGPATILTITRDAGSPTPYVPGYAAGTVVYHGDVARNTVSWKARSSYGTTLSEGAVSPQGTGAYLCDEPGTANGEQYPYEWGGLVCRYHRYSTYVPIYISNPNECGVTVEAGGSALAWKAWPFGIKSISVRGLPISVSIGTEWGHSFPVGAPSVTSQPLPCEEEEAARNRSGTGPQTTTSTGWPEVRVAWWDPPIYHPEIPMAPGPNVYGVWCQVTFYYQYGRLVDAQGQCYGRESGM